MLRRWCIPLAILALLAGSGLAAASATAATTTAPAAAPVSVPRMVLPGGLTGHLPRPGGTALARGGVRARADSTNWSGYVAAAGTYTSVSSSWAQPAGQCASSDQYAAFWVGLDGYSSSSVEQIGTMIECPGRTAEYTSWYEMYPGNPVYFSNTVSPGDQVTGSVTYDGSNGFTLYLADTTKGWSHTVNASLPGAARSSAEVVLEAPCCTASGGTLPLADFGTASFTGATANGTAIGSQSPMEVIMIDNSGRDKASVSALSGNENFSETWLRSS